MTGTHLTKIAESIIDYTSVDKKYQKLKETTDEYMTAVLNAINNREQ